MTASSSRLMNDQLITANQLRDNSALLLSDSQQQIFSGWRRPDHIFPLSTLPQDGIVLRTGSTMKAQGKIDLVQDVTSDCSVVASLCAVTVRADRGHSNVGVSAFPKWTGFNRE